MFRHKDKHTMKLLETELWIKNSSIVCPREDNTECIKICPKTTKIAFYALCDCFDIAGTGKVIVKDGSDSTNSVAFEIYVSGLTSVQPYMDKSGEITRDYMENNRRVIEIAYIGCATAIIRPRHLSSLN